MTMARHPEGGEDGFSLHRTLTYRISRIQAKLSAQAARLLKQESGLSVTQWRILTLIRSCGGASASELARMSVIDPGLFSRRLKTLVAEGYVRSRTDDRDSRVQHLSLTRRGLAVYEVAVPVMRARREWLRNLLTDAEEKALLAALDKLDAGSERTDFEL